MTIDRRRQFRPPDIANSPVGDGIRIANLQIIYFRRDSACFFRTHRKFPQLYFAGWEIHGSRASKGLLRFPARICGMAFYVIRMIL